MTWSPCRHSRGEAPSGVVAAVVSIVLGSWG
jgi:hypothetical protein